MAAQPPTFSEEDKRLIRLRSMNFKVSKDVLYFIFEVEASNRPQSMSLIDFYSSNGVEIAKFKKGLSYQQQQKIEDDPDGKTFDVTLLYQCLCKGSHLLAAENDDIWKVGNGSLESSITSVKNTRNEMAHEEPRYTLQQFFDKTEELRTLLTKTLELAKIHYGLDFGKVDQKIADMDSSINKYRDDDLTPLDFKEYKKQLLFPAQSDLMNTDGKEDVKKQYENRSDTIVTTVNHLIDISNPVEDIFTEMKLKNELKSGKDEAISFEDILQDESQNITDSIILVDGIAGVGKTTLVKKVLSEWMLGKGSIKHLDSYNLILHAECRNTAIKSFQELLDHRMPNVSKKFKGDDLKKVALAQKILVILDGLDEVNESSTLLFKEVLQLKKDFGITVMVTTRPEKLRYFQQHVQSLHIMTKHIRLLGVPLEKREEFIIRYYREIERIYPDKPIQTIDGLLHYLQETKYRLQDLWSLPYNLTLLTILWALNIMQSQKINTAPELYRETDQLYEKKLMERLVDCPNTRRMQDLERLRAVKIFMFHLAKEALIGLKNDHINLPSEAYQRLTDTCHEVKVPIEEMISAFLKRVPATSDVIYSFPHKGIQDYKAAQYTWMILSGKHKSSEIKEILTKMNDLLTQYNVPPLVTQDIVRIAEEKLKKISSGKIRSIFEDIHGSEITDMSKYQNVIIHLIGLFFSETEKIKDAVKMEALQILQETGVSDRDEWLRILQSVKCDNYVASFISKQKGILEGFIKIDDSSIFAYTSLLQGMKTPLEGEHEVTIKLDIRGETLGIKELMGEINKKKLEVTEINLWDGFRNPSRDQALEDSTNEAFKRCRGVTRYFGRLTPGLVLPFTLVHLWVSIASARCCATLEDFLLQRQGRRPLFELNVCVRLKDIDTEDLKPLNGTTLWPPSLYIADIQDVSDVEKGLHMAEKLQPTTGEWRCFEGIYFPRMDPAVPVEDVLKKMMEKGRIRVLSYIVFPSSCRPSQSLREEEEELQQLAKNIGRGDFSPDLFWGQVKVHGGHFDDNIDEW